MEEKKKDDGKHTDSKYLTPFSSNTPRTERASASSVFLTPPSTGGHESANIPCFPRHTGKIPFNLSLEADELDQVYKFDILKGLSVRGLQHTVIRHILSFMDDLSLFRATHVCKEWRSMIRGVSGVEKERIKRFMSSNLKYCKEQGKENFGINKRARNYAHSILENTPKSPAKIFKSCTNLTSKCRPCPKCNSPAIINPKENAYCEQCHERFCLQCFKNVNGHDSEACIKISTPITSVTKHRKCRGQMIGSKQSKERLRRLSRGSKKS